MKRWRVGVVGASFGANVHVPAFRAQGRFDVVAIASPNRAARIAEERGVPAAFASLDAMLAGVELDVVAIASPPFAHHDDVLTALGARKHVLCEKPMALSLRQAEAMVAAAARAGTVCALAHEFRYTPARAATRELIDNGHLGPLREIEVAYLDRWLRPSGERPNSWWFQRRCGGGITGAILSHLVDLAIYLAGRPPVQAAGFEHTANRTRTVRGETFTSDVADGAFTLLDFGDGLVGRVLADATRPVASTTVAVHGELRAVASTGPNLIEATTFTIDEDETAELQLMPSPHAKLGTIHGNLPPFVELLDRFAAALDATKNHSASRTAPTDYPTFSDGLATQRVLETIGYTI